MDNLKDDAYYIDKVLESIAIIQEYTKDKTAYEIENDIPINNIVMFQFTLIEENVNKLSNDFKKKNDSIPWNQIKGLRNVIVHDYTGIKYSSLYNTIKIDLPVLKEKLMKIKDLFVI